MENLLLAEYPNHNCRNVKSEICTLGQSHRAPTKSQAGLQSHCYDKEIKDSDRKFGFGYYILRQLMYDRGVYDAASFHVTLKRFIQLLILHYDQQMHNYSTNYHTATCFDTIVSS
jgi:hypothetical protein